MSQVRQYPTFVFWSDEDSGYIALAQDLPGCSAFGETQAEALSELGDAIFAWIAAAVSAGNPIPEPSKPKVDPSASGRMLLRLPKSLHADVLSMAKDEGVSGNQFVVSALAGVVAAKSVSGHIRVIASEVARDIVPTKVWPHSEVFGVAFGTAVTSAIGTIKHPVYARIEGLRVRFFEAAGATGELPKRRFESVSVKPIGTEYTFAS